MGDYEIGRNTKLPVLYMAQPYRNPDGTVAGVVMLGLSLDWWGRQLAGIDLPPGGTAVIMHCTGIILARTPDLARYVGQPIPASNRFSTLGERHSRRRRARP